MRTLMLSTLVFFVVGCGSESFHVGVAHVAVKEDKDKDKEVDATLSLTDEDGESIGASSDDITVEVHTRVQGGEWTSALEVQLGNKGTGLVDVMLVADNSGSEKDYLTEIREAVRHFSHVIMARDHVDRVGLVRTSTVSYVMQTLTGDHDEISAAADELFVTNGWTALWDGVRLSNDQLAEGAAQPADEPQTVCAESAYRSIVIFTDGADNNSSNEHPTDYPDDGIDTKLADLLAMDIHGVRTAVYAVGVGNDVDEESLKQLTEETGGTYRAIANYGGLVGALRSAGNQLADYVPICFKVANCEHTRARVAVTVDGEQEQQTYEFELPNTCP